MPPETIADRYRVGREVGRGASGAVWLCRDERLGREVAVKQVGHLPGGRVPDLARAMREARSSAALNHRNVVAVYDAIEEGDHIWLVMEYVPGRTLSRIVAEDGPLSPERAARIGAQVADGLAAAHARGTVHRDVKPGNILVTDDDLAKISDFGIARNLSDEKLTETGLMTGTPAYFSPEVARGEDPTPAADVWALGASLYAAVEGHPPFPDKRNPLALLGTIANERPPPPTRAGVLAEPIGRMLDPDPRSRWGMADCAHALHRIHERHGVETTREETAPEPAVAPPPEPAPRPAEVRRPEPSEPAPAPPPPAAASAPDRGGRRRRAVLVVAALGLLVVAVAVGWSLLGPGEEAPRTSADTSDAGKSPAAGAKDREPEPTAEEPPADSGGGSTAGRVGFVEDYYGVLPDDTRTGWSLLSPGYRQEVGSYQDYDGFWSTIDSVSVDDTRPAGPAGVDVTLTYTSDGGSEQEVRRIQVERSGDGYLITGDRVVG